jgi:hypothetical protein
VKAGYAYVALNREGQAVVGREPEYEDCTVIAPSFERFVQDLATGRAYQLERYRRMTPSEKLSAMTNLYWSARQLKVAFVRQQHPDWSEAQIQREVKRQFQNVRD